MEREIALYTLEGVKDAAITTHHFTTEDGLGLHMFRFLRKPCDDVVMIIHGLTTSSDMFIMPEHYNLVQYLLDNGFTDVWCLDYRMSNRYPYNLLPHRYNMDDIALFDYPPAVQTIRNEARNCRIHVIAHCLGAVSFAMSLFGKAVTGINSAVLNSAALTPRIPRWSQFKIAVSPFLVEYVLGRSYINPRWGEDPGLTLGKIFAKVVSMFHRECEVPSCHMLSLMWGTGWPALYSHENLKDVTHRRGGDLYGPCSTHYYRHVRKKVENNNTAVKFDSNDPTYGKLPDNYFEYVMDVATPVLLTTGADNHVFTDSNVEFHYRLRSLVPNRHQLHIFPGYGHQDVFMGKHVHIDIFPRILKFLQENQN